MFRIRCVPHFGTLFENGCCQRRLRVLRVELVQGVGLGVMIGIRCARASEPLKRAGPKGRIPVAALERRRAKAGVKRIFQLQAF
jgi:hypothetical protein